MTVPLSQPSSSAPLKLSHDISASEIGEEEEGIKEGKDGTEGEEGIKEGEDGTEGGGGH
jgi:hypothetical protein